MRMHGWSSRAAYTIRGAPKTHEGPDPSAVSNRERLCSIDKTPFIMGDENFTQSILWHFGDFAGRAALLVDLRCLRRARVSRTGTWKVEEVSPFQV